MIRIFRFLPVFGLLALATPVDAAIVTFYLSIDDNNGQSALTGKFDAPGQWTLYATVSTGDNYGLAGFTVSLVRTTSTILDAPKSIYHDFRSDSEDPSANPDTFAGFNVRSVVNFDSSPNPFVENKPAIMISAAQVTPSFFTGPGYIVEHLGQSSGNLLPPPAGWDSSFFNTQTTYYNVLKIAHGTYDINNSPPDYVPDPNPTYMVADVLQQDIQGLVSSAPTSHAQVVALYAGPHTFVGGETFIVPLPPLDVPEPASFCFLAIAPLLLFRRRKASELKPRLGKNVSGSLTRNSL